MFDEFIGRKKPLPEKLMSYGFSREGEYFRYFTEILDGNFELTVKIGCDNTINYVGKIRSAIEQVICDIADKCYETSVFKTAQAQRIIEYVRNLYGDELEFLWKKFPDNAVWRRKDNKKWYGAVLTVAGRKIGLETDDTVEIIDLRMDPAKGERILSREHYYPGWHMNKKSWYTLVLNGILSDEEIKEGIKESYELAGLKA